MKEREITGRVLVAMREDARFGTCAVEIKLVKGTTLPKSALKEHQRRALLIANTGVMYHKIVDAGYQNPFDAVILKKTEAYLVIWYQTKEKAHEVWAIPIADVPDGSIRLDVARHYLRVDV